MNPPLARYTVRRQPTPGAARLPCKSMSVVRLSAVSLAGGSSMTGSRSAVGALNGSLATG